ncbi:Conserved oligomeric Golgi complex subunit 2 [Chlorella vulgaris]
MTANAAVAAATARTDSLSLDRSLPLWFKPELFTQPDFSAVGYVSDLKRYVPLETLSSELHSHLDALKNKLVEVINEDYNDFVSLSTKLVNVDAALNRMQRPLVELQEKLEAVRDSIGGQVGELQSGLQRRQAVAAARELLELMQDTAHVMSKVDKLLGEVKAAGEVSSGCAPEDLEAHCRLLDRVASEVSRLQFYAARGQELELMRQLQPRIDRATAQLQGCLDGALAATLQSQSPAALSICLHAYSAIARPQAAEVVVRTTLVAPVVQAALAEQRAKAAAAGPAAGAQLVDVLSAVTQGLQAQCSPFLEHTLSQAASSQAFDFLGGSLLAEVHSALEGSLPAVFSAGVPAAFHSNFLAGQRFLAALEAYCTTQVQVLQFRGSTAYAAFAKKWNLPVYFSLQFQDIAGALESKLQLQPAGANGSGGGGAAAKGTPHFAWSPSAAVWKGLQRCASSEVFLPQLADKFVRLALQLLARYAAWIEHGIAARGSAAAAAAAAAQAAASGAPPAADSQQAGSTAISAAGGMAGQADASWAAAASPEQLSALRCDVDELLAGLLSSFVPQLSALLLPMPPVAGEAVAAAFADAAERLEGAAAGVMAAAGDCLTEESVDALKQLRGIVASYRMTARSMPSKASPYVEKVLDPLRKFLKAEAAAKLSSKARQQLAEAVVAGVCSRYLALVEETLSTVRKTARSLRRIKARQQGGEGAGPVPDTDKLIEQQLLLDVQEWAQQAQQFGVDVSQLDSYKQLWDAVTTEDEKAAAL